MAKKKCDASKSSKAGELGMTSGRYVQSSHYLIDTADDGYFAQKGRRKASDSSNI